MIDLINQYRNSLRMVERAKRQNHDSIKLSVVVNGDNLGARVAPKGKLVKCPECGKEVIRRHVFRLDEKVVVLCDKCLEKILTRAADIMLDDNTKAKAEDDLTILGSMSSDLRYALEYMETGFVPGCRRGAHRLSSEQREIPVDPYQFQINTHLIKQAAAGRIKPSDLSPERKEMLDDLLALLTEKQKNAFVLVFGRGYTYEQAAKTLNIGITTVQDHIELANKKIFLAVGNRSNTVNVPSISEGDKPSFKKPVQRIMFADCI